MAPRATTPVAARMLPAVLVGIVLLLVMLVLWPFAPALLWAGMLAHLTWPLYRALQTRTRGRNTLSALLMVTGLTGLVMVLPLVIGLLIQDELLASYHAAAGYVSQGIGLLPDMIRRMPGIGQQLHDWLEAHVIDPAGLRRQLLLWLQPGVTRLPAMAGGIGRNLSLLVLALVSLFFLYRDGDALTRQVLLVLHSTVGKRIDGYLLTASRMSRTLVLSVLVAAGAQGLIATLGYWIVGIDAPVLLGVITAVASVVPLFGTFLVWGGICVWLLGAGHAWQAAGLLAWGTLLIHPADNIIRPLFVSNAMRVPFLLVLFGVLGGMLAFGLAGLLLGPIILAVGLSLWQEWVQSIAGPAPGLPLTAFSSVGERLATPPGQHAHQHGIPHDELMVDGASDVQAQQDEQKRP